MAITLTNAELATLESMPLAVAAVSLPIVIWLASNIGKGAQKKWWRAAATRWTSRNQGAEMIKLLQSAFVVATTLCLMACTPERDRLDAEVRRLCAIDGGIKVYETVTLPPEKFNEYGQPRIPNGKDHTGFGYFSVGTDQHIAGRLKGEVGAKLYRSEMKIFRTSDGRLLGQEVAYYRSGGELTEGAVMWEGYSCPKRESWALEKKMFLKGEHPKNSQRLIDSAN